MNTNISTNNAEENTPMSQVSMRKGFWFYFKHKGNDISVHGSGLTATETVYVNNHPVSIKRNFIHFISKHSFVHDGVSYDVEINVKGIFSKDRNMSVTLFADGELVNVETYAFKPNKGGLEFVKEDAWKIILAFSGLVAIGYFVGYFVGVYGTKFFMYLFN